MHLIQPFRFIEEFTTDEHVPFLKLFLSHAEGYRSIERHFRYEATVLFLFCSLMQTKNSPYLSLLCLMCLLRMYHLFDWSEGRNAAFSPAL